LKHWNLFHVADADISKASLFQAPAIAQIPMQPTPSNPCSALAQRDFSAIPDAPTAILSAQMAAIRDLLLSSSGEWTIEQVAAQFNGAQQQKKAIFENLERLEWFGILISREEGGVTRWQFAQIQQVARSNALRIEFWGYTT
jgi:hypothetical protein